MSECRVLRQQRQLTQQKLAVQLGVSVGYISKVETERLQFGDYPSEKFIHKLAEALEADEDELLLLTERVPEAIRRRVVRATGRIRSSRSIGRPEPRLRSAARSGNGHRCWQETRKCPMSVSTKIQWCDSTCNPTMGCDGCELWDGTTKKCYAGVLHVRFGGVTKGYAPSFEEVTRFPGRMEQATRWSDLRGKSRSDKPWLNGYPRLVFVSDMSDALSEGVPFEYLKEEVIDNVTSPAGRRHHWLWLTKRPNRMAKFSQWLAKGGISWPSNSLGRTEHHDSANDQSHPASAQGGGRLHHPFSFRRATVRGD